MLKTTTELIVGMVGPLPPPQGGIANQTAQLARLLREEGVVVEVVRTNEPYKPDFIKNIKVVRAFFRLIPFMAKLWRMTGRVHIVHVMANSGWSWHFFVAPAVWVAYLRGVPIIINYRGGRAEEFFQRSFRFVNPTLKKANLVTVPSGFLKEVFARYGISTRIIPNIIDLNKFSIQQHGRPEQWSNGRPNVVVVRNLERIYDNATALRAFQIVQKRIPSAQITVAGCGPERNKLHQLAKELHIEDKVTFTGRLNSDQVVDLYRTADLAVNPSLVDNMPNSVLEALSAGVPVVSTDVGGVPYIVENRVTALLVPPSDPDKMAEAILQILVDVQLANSLVHAGKESVQKYSWSEVKRKLLNVYREIVL